MKIRRKDSVAAEPEGDLLVKPAQDELKEL